MKKSEKIEKAGEFGSARVQLRTTYGQQTYGLRSLQALEDLASTVLESSFQHSRNAGMEEALFLTS